MVPHDRNGGGRGVDVALSAWFPQDRVGFLLGLALWGAACACVATLLRNFAAYAAALAGFTAAILASDTLGATGGTDGHIFNFAIMRVSEIWIGIVCAGIVLAGPISAPRRGDWRSCLQTWPTTLSFISASR